ncbi:MAG: hypothetical protein Kow0075_02800 [Salibacteraceae bacterium]
MNPTKSAIDSLMHFEPLAQLALQRYQITPDGIMAEGNHGTPVDGDDFVVALMELYCDVDLFDAARFESFALPSILEYLERTHALYEMVLIPKIEQAVVSIQRLFPDHVIGDVLADFIMHYKRELLEHIDFEESKFFPYVRRLLLGNTRDLSAEYFDEKHDHSLEAGLEQLLDLIVRDYAEVARSFAYKGLKNLVGQFLLDLRVHHLIEEQVLLPRVKQLEKDANRMPFQ